MTDPTPLPVTQADRDATYAFQREMAERLLADIKNGKPYRMGEEEGDAGPLVQAFARHRIAASAEVERLMEALADLFTDDGHDASLNLQGALDDLRGKYAPNDGGVCASTIERVIGQLEATRAALASPPADFLAGEKEHD